MKLRSNTVDWSKSIQGSPSIVAPKGIGLTIVSIKREGGPLSHILKEDSEPELELGLGPIITRTETPAPMSSGNLDSNSWDESIVLVLG